MEWTARRVGAAVGGAVATAVLVGVPTDVVPNPVFGRAIPVTWWSYPALAAVALLSGLLLATYVRVGPLPSADAGSGDRVQRRGVAAGVLSVFAVGCPVCNKVVLLALGTSGAMTWFAPLQPALAVLSVAGLAWAVRIRWRATASCVVTPPGPATVPVGDHSAGGPGPA